MKTVVIDVGHYAKYNAGIIKGYYESVRMWALGLKLKDKLEEKGVKVVMTRANQAKDMGLGDRARVAIKNKADLFVSLHSNAAGSTLKTSNKTVKGVVVFYSIDQPKIKPFASKVAQAVSVAMGSCIDRVAYWESQKYKGEDYLTIIDVAQDGGVPRVILIEHGFHTNPDDCKALMDDAVLDKIADAECKIFCLELGIH